MRSLYPNLLSLSEWAQYMGLDPWVMAGFCNAPAPINSSTQKCCDGVWSEFTFQRNQLARTDVSSAIQQAEEMFATSIGYWPAPKTIAGEQRDYPWGDGLTAPKGMINRNGSFKSVKLRYGYAQAMGKETYELLETATLTPTYAMGYVTTKDEKAVPDHFTLTVTLPTGMTPDEIRVYHTAANRLNEPREQWEIRPLAISMSGQDATITGDAWLFGKPKTLISIPTDCLDATDVNGSYVANVEVWQCHLDQTQHGNFIWEDYDCASVPCGETRKSFCATIRQEQCSFVVPRPATYDTELESFKWSTECFPAAPRRLEANYRAGIPLVNGKMETRHGKTIAMLAASLLDCEVCACNCTKDRLMKYSQYESFLQSDGNGAYANKTWSRVKNSRTELNPFGERYGQIQAWMLARNWIVCNSGSM